MERQYTSDPIAVDELSSIGKHHLLLAVVIGLVVGGLAVAFEWTASLVASLQSDLASASHGFNGNLLALLVCCGFGGALAGALTQFLAPEAGGSGIPHVKAVLSHGQPLRGLRVLVVKFLGGALVIGGKFSLGREGPTVHIGASVADEIAKRAKVPSSLRDHLIACGAGAGLAAAFNAPLAGFLFVIEELRREVNSVTLGMALVGTVLADAVVQIYHGPAPMLMVPDLDVPSLGTMPAVLSISLLATLGGLLFNRALVRGVVAMPARAALWARGAVVGAVVGACIYFVPSLTIDEQGVFAHFLTGGIVADASCAVLAALFIGKLMLTVACYATGVPGGIFAPMLVQGAFIGLLTLKLLSLTPLHLPSEGVGMVIAMTAFFAASVRAPFTGVVLLAEMTNGFTLLLPLMAAALVGYFIGELTRSKPIYESLLAISRDHER